MKLGTFALISLLVGTACAADPALPARARQVLLDALAREQAFIKVHAAEALIAVGETAAPRAAFLAELPAANDVRPYRMGVWRVLAGSSPDAAERASWVAKIEEAFVDPTTSDRIHAIESLCKLGVAPTARVRAAITTMLATASESDAVFLHWALHLGGNRAAIPAVLPALESKDPAARLRAAYMLQWLKVTDPAARAAVARTAAKEPRDAIGYAIIVSAAVALEADPKRTAQWVRALEEIVAHGSAGARYMACQALMRRYTAADVQKLAPLLDEAEGDARIGGSWAILHIMSRHAK